MAVKGSFKDISFVEMVQLMALARKTGRMEITHENKWAMVIFREGEVWHIEPRGFHGMPREEIFYFLMNLKDANFAFQRLQVLPMLDRTITLSIENLLMEGAKRQDEEEAIAEVNDTDEPSELDNLLNIKAGAEAKVRYAPQNTKRLLMAINGQRSITEVIRETEMDATQAATIIKDLITQGVVEMMTPAAAAYKAEAETDNKTTA